MEVNYMNYMVFRFGLEINIEFYIWNKIEKKIQHKFIDRAKVKMNLCWSNCNITSEHYHLKTKITIKVLNCQVR